MFGSLTVLELDGHTAIETEMGGGLVTASCTCGRFVIQGEALEVAEALDSHMTNEGIRAGLQVAG